MTVVNNILKAAVVFVVLLAIAVNSHEDINAVSNTFHGVDVSYLLMFHMTLPHNKTFVYRTISRQYIQLIMPTMNSY